MPLPPREVIQLSGGDVALWVGEGETSVMLKAVTRFGDPVELNSEQLKELCEALMRLARGIE